uniref:Phospholipase A2-like central domain-containing protein n=1 Tax=Biomphalaria glabrata TaxID=6526 RepID=A0A2C9K7U3_BIOGL
MTGQMMVLVLSTLSYSQLMKVFCEENIDPTMQDLNAIIQSNVSSNNLVLYSDGQLAVIWPAREKDLHTKKCIVFNLRKSGAMDVLRDFGIRLEIKITTFEVIRKINACIRDNMQQFKKTDIDKVYWTHSLYKRGFLDNFLWILPGTKWCGKGDTAKHPLDLGLWSDTDACCREHDGCEYTIMSGVTKYNLYNSNSYTISHCTCDEKFATCLRKVNSIISYMVGNVFFNIIGVRCFQLNGNQSHAWTVKPDRY